VSIKKSTNQKNQHKSIRAKNPITYQSSREWYVDLYISSDKDDYITSLINEYQDAGHHSADWYANELAAGIYIINLKLDGVDLMRKAIHIK